jgi:phenylacetate-CoA ligase
MGVLADETLPRGELEQQQLERLRSQLTIMLADNPFYRNKLHAAGIRSATDITCMADLTRLPHTTKQELSEDQREHPPYGTNCSLPHEAYSRLHQTSGTTGERLRWLDTPQCWNWWGRCWQAVYRAAGVGADDRIFFAFSFGPFIGFWSAYEGASQLGALAITGGGMSSQQRLQAILANQATVLVCTPTYALHLAEVANGLGMDIANSAIRRTIHAGEPGASIPATKSKIERAWGARCFDHAGATEVGAWGFECDAQDGLHVNESEFICEVLDPQTLQPSEEGELVVTNLDRAAMPVVRYRTGDRVRWHDQDKCPCGRTYRRIAGGVIGRLDDVLIIRGINVYPSAVEAAVRQFDQIVEYAVEAFRRGEMDELVVRVELVEGESDDAGSLRADLERALHENLGIRAGVEFAGSRELPRFELKAKRVTDSRPRP